MTELKEGKNVEEKLDSRVVRREGNERQPNMHLSFYVFVDHHALPRKQEWWNEKQMCLNWNTFYVWMLASLSNI